MSVRKAAKAGAWSAFDVLLRQSVGFLVLMIMARLLTPADFGIVALVTFFASMSIVFVQGGLSQALIQRQQTTPEEESAVFWWNLAGSGTLAAVILLAAPGIARFYGQSVLEPLMLAAAAQIMFSALGAVQTALLTRSLQFQRLAIAGAAASILSGVFGIGAAVMGYGVWALAIQLTSLAAINSLVLWFACPWRPVLHFRFGTIRSLFGFGIYLSMSSALDVLYTQGFALIIGKLHGVRDLGLYNRAHSTQALPGNILSSMVARIAFPLFSARSEDTEGLRRGIRMANSIGMILNFPAMIGLALLSDLVIVSLFGDQWLPSAPILAILALGGLLLPVHINNLQLLLARADSRRFFQLELIKKAVGLLFVGVGSTFGIYGLAWSVVLFSFVAIPINVSPAKAAIRYGPAAQLWDLRGLLLPSATMAALLLLLKPALDLSPPVELAILAATGAAVYLGSGLALRIGAFVEAKEIALSIVRRSPAAD